VFETGSGDGPKSESSKRTVPLSGQVVDALRAWRMQQRVERLALGADWPGTNRVFTYPDGRPLTGQYVSERFEVLAYLTGPAPIRFHDLRHGRPASLRRRAWTRSTSAPYSAAAGRRSPTRRTSRCSPKS
jgi:integrase